MPWDSVDKYRDEDATERRKTSRRRWGSKSRRKNDASKPERLPLDTALWYVLARAAICVLIIVWIISLVVAVNS